MSSRHRHRDEFTGSAHEYQWQIVHTMLMVAREMRKNTFRPYEIWEALRRNGAVISLLSVHDRFRDLVKLGHLARERRGVYRLTEQGKAYAENRP